MKRPGLPYILHVRRAGRGRPVVLLHGVAGSGAIWGDVATELAQRFDVIRLDLLGYGYSPKPPVDYHMDDHLAAIRATLQSLSLDEPPVLVGLSMGALLALEYAARYPAEVSQVVCIGLPYYRSRHEAREKLRETFWANLVLHRAWLARIVIPIIWGSIRHSSWLSNRLAPKMYTAEVARESVMATYRSFGSTMRRCMVDYRLDNSLAKITSPVLFIHGARDQWTPPSDVESVVKRLPDARLVIIDGQLHNVVVFTPQAVATATTEFLTKPELLHPSHNPPGSDIIT